MEGRTYGQQLNELFSNLDTYPSQGVLTAGALAYAYNGKTYDLLGLNNTKMAHADKEKNPKAPKNHASFNKGVFYELSPDIFWLAMDFYDDYQVKGRVKIKGMQVAIFQEIYKDTYTKNVDGK